MCAVHLKNCKRYAQLHGKHYFLNLRMRFAMPAPKGHVTLEQENLAGAGATAPVKATSDRGHAGHYQPKQTGSKLKYTFTHIWA